MKVLMISHMYARPDNPDAATFISRQVVELTGRGVEIKTISAAPLAPPVWGWNSRLRQSLAASRSAPRSWHIDGIDVLAPRYVKLPGAWDFGLFGPLYFRGIRRAVHHLHREWAFDLIHGQMLVPDGYAAARLGRELGVPSVVTERGYLSSMALEGSHHRRALRWTIEHSDQCVFVSQALADLAAGVGAPVSPFRVVYTGCDPHVFASESRDDARAGLGLPRDAIVVLHVGENSIKKGVDLLLEAFAGLAARHSRAILCLVGAGLLDPWLTRRSAQLGLQGRVLITGFRPHREIPRWLAACDLVAHPSRAGKEGLPNALVEAGAMARPVVASRTAGIPEVVLDGKSGVLVGPGDVEALAAALERLISDPHQAREMGLAARDHVLGRFSWSRHGGEMLAVYREVLERNPASH